MSTAQSSEPLAALLQRYRAAAGLTQEELAERAALSRRCIADLERGARRNPYPATVRLLADALGLHDVARAAMLAAARTPRETAHRSESLPSHAEYGAPHDRTLRVVDSARAVPTLPPHGARRRFDIQYALRSDGARTAFGVAGSGPVLLIPPGVISHLEWWETAPGVSAFLQ